MTHPIPSNDDLCKISTLANSLAKDIHAAFWLEIMGHDGDYQRDLALGHFERLAELFGARLVYDEPDYMTRFCHELSAAIAAAGAS